MLQSGPRLPKPVPRDSNEHARARLKRCISIWRELRHSSCSWNTCVGVSRRHSFVQWSAAQYCSEALALPAGQPAMTDEPPANFSALLATTVFIEDPWLPRAFQVVQVTTAGAVPDVYVPGTSIASWDRARMFPCSTAGWHQWKDLPDKVGLVVSTAYAPPAVPPPIRWAYLRRTWDLRHFNAITGAIHLPSRKDT
jgi:hypothetical protein